MNYVDIAYVAYKASTAEQLPRSNFIPDLGERIHSTVVLTFRIFGGIGHKSNRSVEADGISDSDHFVQHFVQILGVIVQETYQTNYKVAHT